MKTKKKSRAARVIVWLLANEPAVTAGLLVLLALGLVGAVERGMP